MLAIEIKRLIGIFKTFIEKVFVPYIPKMDPNVQKEWAKMTSMLAMEQLSMNEVQLYVDSLPTLQLNLSPPNGSSSLNGSFQGLNISGGLNRNIGAERTDNKPSFMARKDNLVEGSAQQWNPLRTIGGERNRIIFQDEPGQNNSNFNKGMGKDQDESMSGLTTQGMLPVLQRLYKVFGQNQTKMEKALNPPAYQN